MTIDPRVCPARGCRALTPPRRLLCVRHWRLVPVDLKKAVWDAYVPDQDAITASDAYLAAAKAAIEAVALYDPFSQGQASIVAAVNACTLLVPEDGRVADPLFVTPSPSEPEKDPFP